MSTEALIELDRSEPSPQEHGAPPAHHYRRAGLLVCALLVLSLAGSGQGLAPLWRRDGLVPVVGTDTVFAVAGDTLYATVVADGERTVSAWSLRPFRQRWTVALPAGDVDRMELWPVPGRVLVRVRATGGDFSTTALDAGTGDRAWVVPWAVRPLPGGHTGLVQDQDFAEADRYDEESGAAGPLYFAENGAAYRRPPAWTTLRGIDLADGRERWSQRRRGSIFAAPAEAVPPSVVVVAAQRAASTSTTAQLLDADTGGLHMERTFEQTGGDTTGEEGNLAVDVVDGLLVLERVDGTGSVRTAYGLGDLADRWRLPYRGVDGTSRFCAGVPCVETSSGLSVLDPATGAVRWKAPPMVDLAGRDGHTVEVNYGGSFPEPRRTVDRMTGEARVDLTAWPTLVAGEQDAPLVVAAPDDRGGTTFGVLPKGARAIRVLGRAESPVSDCRADNRFVACRTGGGVEIFEYRP